MFFKNITRTFVRQPFLNSFSTKTYSKNLPSLHYSHECLLLIKISCRFLPTAVPVSYIFSELLHIYSLLQCRNTPEIPFGHTLCHTKSKKHKLCHLIFSCKKFPVFSNFFWCTAVFQILPAYRSYGKRSFPFKEAAPSPSPR